MMVKGQSCGFSLHAKPQVSPLSTPVHLCQSSLHDRLSLMATLWILISMGNIVVSRLSLLVEAQLKICSNLPAFSCAGLHRQPWCFMAACLLFFMQGRKKIQTPSSKMHLMAIFIVLLLACLVNPAMAVSVCVLFQFTLPGMHAFLPAQFFYFRNSQKCKIPSQCRLFNLSKQRLTTDCLLDKLPGRGLAGT